MTYLSAIWVTEIEAAKQLQNELRDRVIREDQFGTVQRIAGVDVAFAENNTITKAAVVVLSYPDLTVLESAIAHTPTTFPYVPGFLSFREIPALIQALDKISLTPDLIFCDGQGIAHPRRLGIASHLGVLMDIPTIGVAKSILVGKHEPVPLDKGQWVPLVHQKEVIGAALRSRVNVKPLYISLGHKISLETAIAYVQNCLTKYRLPEPTRLADKLSKTKID
ncbi:MAG: deoxyribonuclease V [Snowella sp.]|nr:deoxyribonuclease V [Snowella sp.]